MVFYQIYDLWFLIHVIYDFNVYFVNYEIYFLRLRETHNALQLPVFFLFPSLVFLLAVSETSDL